jgi:regulator of nonsense transcripts 1
MEKDFNKMEDFWAKTRFKFIDITGNDRYEDRIQNPDWEIGVDDQNQPLYNQKEIDTIIKILMSMVRDYNIDPKDIGIIAAYSGQKNKLKQLIKNIDIIKDIEVNTVDGYQGDQKDYILFSTVRSNDKGDIGFLNDDKRVNVALTRAKYGLFVLGNRETLNNSRSKTWKDIVDFFQRQGSVIDAYYF